MEHFGAGYPEDGHVVAVTIGGEPDVGLLDVDCGVKAVEGGDGEFTCPDQSEEGGGEACPHRCVEEVAGVELAEEHLDEGEGEGEGFSFGTFRGGGG